MIKKKWCTVCMDGCHKDQTVRMMAVLCRAMGSAPVHDPEQLMHFVLVPR